MRQRLAETWHVPPWEVDDPALRHEVARQLEMWTIEYDNDMESKEQRARLKQQQREVLHG